MIMIMWEEDRDVPKLKITASHDRRLQLDHLIKAADVHVNRGRDKPGNFQFCVP
jgi:hypothetical protein